MCGPMSEQFAPADVEAFVLAGGRSTRMGRDKARLDWNGVPLAVHLAHGLAPHVARVRLVAKPDSGLEDLGLEMLYDAVSDGALVHGIRAALAAPGAAWRWLVACDMPGVDPTLLQVLWRQAFESGAPGAALRLPDRSEPEPMPSLWSHQVADRITADWGLAARDWVHHARLAIVAIEPGDADRFANVNTPAEWEAFRARNRSPEGR